MSAAAWALAALAVVSLPADLLLIGAVVGRWRRRRRLEDEAGRVFARELASSRSEIL